MPRRLSEEQMREKYQGSRSASAVQPARPMRRLAPRAAPLLALLLLLSSGCGLGGRDAHDIAADFEGSVSSQATVERLVRDIDLSHAAVSVSVGRDDPRQFGESDQGALEAYLHEVFAAAEGDRARVTQQVVDDLGSSGQRLTLTLSVEHDGQTRYVPATLELARVGRRMVITSLRLMNAMGTASAN
jgi:hypothetical protein